jgi:hypothetical protein
VITYRVQTDSPVAFITIDDGYFTDPDADAFMAAQTAAGTPVPVTQFLTYYAASSGQFPPPTSGDGLAHVEALRLYQTGTPDQKRVGCHQKEHLDYRGQSEADQQAAMAAAADWLGGADMFNWRPTLFRPPYGQYDDATLAAVQGAGMTQLVLWGWAFEQPSLTLTNEYDDTGVMLKAGSILCLHHPSQPDQNGYLLQQLQDALAFIEESNLYPAWLGDFL